MEKISAMGEKVSFMLKGEYSHNIDAKGRLIIPAKFRDDLGENFVITKGMENCLYVYPEDEWNDFEKKLNALPMQNLIRKLCLSVWGSVPRYGTRPDGMKRMLKWSLTLKRLHRIWKQAGSVSRGRRYGIQTQISITK